jgi:hypothetical protein
METSPEVDTALETPGVPDALEAAEALDAPEAPEAPEALSQPNGEASAEAVSRPGSLPAWWTDSYPQVSDVRSATSYLNSLGGAISREEKDGRWVLSTGDQALFEADTSEELDGFVLGFALSQLIADRHGPISRAQRPG